MFNQKYPNQRSNFNHENGFTTWRKVNSRIQDHENSPAHRSAFLAWEELERELNKSGQIDDHLQQQIDKAAKKWREILERITATVKTLSQQN
jgi:phosphoribosylaminoimidazole (AIR) synthetase